MTSSNVVPGDLVPHVRAGMTTFMVALKNQALYPETNKIRQESKVKLLAWLDAFLEAESHLCLTVKKGQLLYLDEVVYQERAAEQSLIYPLYRDGVKWFEFHEGLPVEELNTFIDLLNRFRILKDEAEDDLVTAMWEQDFIFLKYKTADDFWGMPGDAASSGPIRNLLLHHRELSIVRDGGPQSNKTISEMFSASVGSLALDDSRIDEAQEATDSFAQSVLGAYRDTILGELSPEENEYLRTQIEEDKFNYTTHDSLDVIATLLKEVNVEPYPGPLLEFLTEGVKQPLIRGDVGRMREFMEKLLALPTQGKPWLATLLNEFQKVMATEAMLNLAMPAGHETHLLTREYYEELYRFLLLLIPESLMGLAALVNRAVNEHLEKVLLMVIAFQTGRAGSSIVPSVLAIPVVNLINRLKPQDILEVITIMRAYHLTFPAGLLEGLTRHGNAQVRETAATVLLEADPNNIMKLTHLVDDAHPSLHQLVCHYLTQVRNPFSEKVFFDYLKALNLEDPGHTEEHILNSYRALGRACVGPGEVVPFLEEVLTGGAWRSVLGQGRDCHRQGAALALALMPEAWGGGVLNKAAKSSFKTVRQACEDALAEVRPSTTIS